MVLNFYYSGFVLVFFSKDFKFGIDCILFVEFDLKVKEGNMLRDFMFLLIGGWFVGVYFLGL